MSDLCDIGITGLATMGANLARNAARKGFAVAVHNRTASRADDLVRNYGSEGTFVAAQDIAGFVAALRKPRAIMMMVKAGKPVDDVIEELLPHLDEGDVLIDGGNSLFTDTLRREKSLSERNIRYIGTGVSGGEEGALEGPSIMPGGTPEAYERVRPIFEKMAAQVDGVPCCTYIGPDGAGHYVKMVHNGIEYADMQLIAEAYELLRTVYGYGASEIAGFFEKWNEGDLNSYLIEISAKVLRKTDAATGKPLVDLILDEAEQKGTGRWTAQQALEMGVPITAITEAVFARSLSSFKSEREAAAKLYAAAPKTPGEAGGAEGADARGSGAERDDAKIDAVRDALYASKIVAYAQGFAQMAAASKLFGWNLDLGKIATIWRGGCIIRARFLDRIRDAYEGESQDTNLLMLPYFRDAIIGDAAAWRQTIVTAVQNGVATPAFSSCLAYFDGYLTARGPANLIQGLRDFFGSHTYERIDKDGSYHVLWSGNGEEIKTTA
jgi:6-phosphogluconate dehydrogenase